MAHGLGLARVPLSLGVLRVQRRLKKEKGAEAVEELTVCKSIRQSVVAVVARESSSTCGCSRSPRSQVIGGCWG